MRQDQMADRQATSFADRQIDLFSEFARAAGIDHGDAARPYDEAEVGHVAAVFRIRLRHPAAMQEDPGAASLKERADFGLGAQNGGFSVQSSGLRMTECNACSHPAFVSAAKPGSNAARHISLGGASGTAAARMHIVTNASNTSSPGIFEKVGDTRTRRSTRLRPPVAPDNISERLASAPGHLVLCYKILAACPKGGFEP